MKLRDLADIKIVRDRAFETLSFLRDASKPSLVFVDDERHLSLLHLQAMAVSVITSAKLAPGVPDDRGLALSEAPRRRFFEINNVLARERNFFRPAGGRSIHPTAVLHPSVTIADRGVDIGADCHVDASATIGEHVALGSGVSIGVGVVIGAEGFVCARSDGEMLDLAHGGGVRIGSNVSVRANTVIARGLFEGETVLGEGTRVGNLAWISHQVEIGECTIIGHGARVNGFARIGAEAWIGPGAVISDRVSIGAGARVNLGAVVVRDVAPGVEVSGNFAEEHGRFLRQHLAPRS